MVCLGSGWDGLPHGPFGETVCVCVICRGLKRIFQGLDQFLILSRSAEKEEAANLPV